MNTCLSDDHPIWSLLVAGVYSGVGTFDIYTAATNVFAGTGGGHVLFRLLWLPIGFASYGLALYTLRYGVSHRSDRVMRLFEPRWLAENRE